MRRLRITPNARKYMGLPAQKLSEPTYDPNVNYKKLPVIVHGVNKLFNINRDLLDMAQEVGQEFFIFHKADAQDKLGTGEAATMFKDWVQSVHDMRYGDEINRIETVLDQLLTSADVALNRNLRPDLKEERVLNKGKSFKEIDMSQFDRSVSYSSFPNMIKALKKLQKFWDTFFTMCYETLNKMEEAGFDEADDSMGTQNAHVLMTNWVQNMQHAYDDGGLLDSIKTFEAIWEVAKEKFGD